MKRWSMFTLCVIEPVLTNVTRLMLLALEYPIEKLCPTSMVAQLRW